MVQIQQPNNEMFVKFSNLKVFIRVLREGTFGESLVQRRSENMKTIKILAASHIKAEEITIKKRETCSI